jgi:hypothetical protein
MTSSFAKLVRKAFETGVLKTPGFSGPMADIWRSSRIRGLEIIRRKQQIDTVHNLISLTRGTHIEADSQHIRFKVALPEPRGPHQ